MKGRWLTLLVGLLLGAAIGYFGAQKATLQKAIPFLKDAGSVMTDEGVRLYNKAKGIPNSPPTKATNPTAVVPATRVEVGPDKPAYIRDFLRMTDVKIALEKSPNEAIQVTGRIRNLGESALREITLNVFFLGTGDLQDKRVEVLQGGALPAWQERTFSIRTANVNGEWSSARASIVDIAF